MASFTDIDETGLPLYKTQEYQLPTDAKMKLFGCDLSSVSEVKGCLDAGALPMYFNKEGTTAVHMACSLNAVDSVRLMLDTYHSTGSAAHALEARTDATQETLLLVACSYGSLECVHYLLELGAIASDQNSYGNTCLHLACGAPKNASAIVNLLLKQSGVNVTATNGRGGSAIHFAPFALPEAEAVSVCETLMQNGAHVNARDASGDTPLHVAVTKKSVLLMRTLLKLGADASIKDNNQFSPVDMADSYSSGAEHEALMAVFNK